jgi:hypothetical protein
MVDNPVLMIVDKLRLRCTYGAAVFIPQEVREWTALLAECAETCQHYFSIFGHMGVVTPAVWPAKSDLSQPTRLSSQGGSANDESQRP